MRRGITVVEMLFAVAVASLVGIAIVSFLVSGASWTQKAGEQAGALLELRAGFARMTHEVQRGSQIVYPPAGSEQPGLAVIAADGRTVFYRLERNPAHPPAAPHDLVREVVGGAREVVAPAVTRLAVLTVDPGPGREARTVRIALTRATRDATAPDGLALVGAASVRALLPYCMAVRQP